MVGVPVIDPLWEPMVSPGGRVPPSRVGQGLSTGIAGGDGEGGDGRARHAALSSRVGHRNGVGDGPAERGIPREAIGVGGRDGHRVGAGRGRGPGDRSRVGVDGQPRRQGPPIRVGQGVPTGVGGGDGEGGDGRARRAGLSSGLVTDTVLVMVQLNEVFPVAPSVSVAVMVTG